MNEILAVIVICLATELVMEKPESDVNSDEESDEITTS